MNAARASEGPPAQSEGVPPVSLSVGELVRDLAEYLR